MIEPEIDIEKAVEAAIFEIEKEHGKGSIFSMNDKVGVKLPHIPTGIAELDNHIIGIGGFPKGRMVEIYGPESGGKTTLALTAIAAAQALGGRCAIVDTEHALDPTWASTLGVNMDQLLVSQPDGAEEALKIVETLLLSKAFAMIVVDSVAAMTTKAEMEGEIGDAHVASLARLMSMTVKKFVSHTANSGTCLVFINQIREKIGVTFGSNETTPGGRALRFYCSLRLDVRRLGQIKKGDENVGNKTKVKAAKNKMSPPFREGEFALLFDRGFDKFGSLIDVAIDRKIIKKSGAWFSFEDYKWQGKDSITSEIETDTALLEKIKNLVNQ